MAGPTDTVTDKTEPSKDNKSQIDDSRLAPYRTADTSTQQPAKDKAQLPESGQVEIPALADDKKPAAAAAEGPYPTVSAYMQRKSSQAPLKAGEIPKSDWVAPQPQPSLDFRPIQKVKIYDESESNEAKAEARRTGKMIVAFVGAPWCDGCREMKENVVPHIEGDMFGGQAVFINVNTDKGGGQFKNPNRRTIPQVNIFEVNQDNSLRRVGAAGSMDLEDTASFLKKHGIKQSNNYNDNDDDDDDRRRRRRNK
ncbi:MAG: thioredoxin family protein [Candidatus Obscuribacterales bacterium]|jgi:thiol-disulfide isomerase/thioredoxin|nr:thioredoxin family protein [Candidatus Obscuribacterales bacterium]